MSTLVTPEYLPAHRSEVTDAWLANMLNAHPKFRDDPAHRIADRIDRLMVRLTEGNQALAHRDYRLALRLLP